MDSSSSSASSSLGSLFNNKLFKFSRCFVVVAALFTLVFIVYSSSGLGQIGNNGDLAAAAAAASAVTPGHAIIIKLKNYSDLVADFRNNDDDNTTTCKYKLPSNKANYTNLIDKQVMSLKRINARLKNMSIVVSKGGKSFVANQKNTIQKHNCSTTSGSDFSRLAFIIPYRNRSDNLKVFLNNMHPYLTRQQIDYGIYLIEPIGNLTFNRALLMNIGFIESQRDMPDLSPPPPTSPPLNMNRSGDNHTSHNDNNTLNEERRRSYWRCFVFHDVDMIPEDERVVYGCSKDSPMHYAVSVSKFGYSTTGYFSAYFGGINSFTRDQFVAINGFSNAFYGWGGEDDDAYLRATHKFRNVIKLPAEIGRYWTHEHTQDKANPERFRLLGLSKQMFNQSGLSTLNYTVKAVQKKPLFTRILVTYPDKPPTT